MDGFSSPQFIDAVPANVVMVPLAGKLKLAALHLKVRRAKVKLQLLLHIYRCSSLSFSPSSQCSQARLNVARTCAAKQNLALPSSGKTPPQTRNFHLLGEHIQIHRKDLSADSS
jgi:hypothetical protein